MQDALSLSDSAYGLGAGIFFLGYFLFEIPANLALLRFGARRWLGTMMLAWAAVSMLTAFVRTPLEFCVVRFTLGLAEAGFSPGITFYLSGWFTSQRWARAYGWYISAIPLSGIIGGPLSGWILHRTLNAHAFMGWQWLFILEGVPSIVIGTLLLLVLRNSPREAAWLTPDEKNAVLQELTSQAQSKKEHRHLAEFVSDARLWALSAIYFCTLTGLAVLGFWAPSMVAALTGRNPLVSGMLIAVPNLFAIAVIHIGAAWSDKSRQRRRAFALAMTFGAGGLALTALSSANIFVTMLGLTVASCGIFPAIALFWSLPVNFLRGTSAAAGIAFINALGNLAGFVSPYGLGVINDVAGSIKPGIILVAFLMVLGGLAVMWLPKTLVDK
jgi:MFS family permease